MTVTGFITNTFILDGFTITQGGYSDGVSGHGGGIYISKTSPTLTPTSLPITDNFANNFGGGVFIDSTGETGQSANQQQPKLHECNDQ